MIKEGRLLIEKSLHIYAYLFIYIYIRGRNIILLSTNSLIRGEIPLWTIPKLVHYIVKICGIHLGEEKDERVTS